MDNEVRQTRVISVKGRIIEIEDTNIIPEDFIGKRFYELANYMNDQGWIVGQDETLEKDPKRGSKIKWTLVKVK